VSSTHSGPVLFLFESAYGVIGGNLCSSHRPEIISVKNHSDTLPGRTID